MSPLVAHATAAAAIFATAVSTAVVPAAAAAVKDGAAMGLSQCPSRARAAPASPSHVPKVLAWGHWGQKRSQDEVAPRAPGSANPQDEGRTAGAGSQQQVLDSSWTHAAFRAFHEMRAGRPLSEVHGSDGEEEEPDTGRGVGAGPLAGVRRLTSSFQRCARF